ncbi:MAG: phosphoglycerate dehydrogenase [Chthoniobacterales bacterium]|nr:phosphoglycerate dehydrogenase [Chthoniobacterales bacterium]
MRVLLTTTSYQDAPGPHHDLLAEQNYQIQRERGPLAEERMLELAGEFDAFLCGDDEITKAVIAKSLPRLRVISKYGVGLDKIDVAECTKRRLPVLYTPGTNHVSVAEHTFCLLLALARHLVESANSVRDGKWLRLTGHELAGKSLGIFGLGRIGQEVAKRAVAFGLKVHAVNRHWPDAFAKDYGVTHHDKIESMITQVDILSLHAGLSDKTRHLLNARTLALAKPRLLLINTARAELVNAPDLIAALDAEQLAGYAADVMEQEPPHPENPLLKHPRVIITPHIGSKTFESIPRQAMRATLNLINYLNGDTDFIQANPF